MLSLVLAILAAVAGGLVEAHTDPEPGTHASHFANVGDYSTALANGKLTPGIALDSLRLLLHEIFVDAVSVRLHKAGVTGCHHLLLKRSDRVISLGIVCLTDLILLHLGDVVELVSNGLPTLIDNLHRVVLLWVVLSQSLLIVTHLGDWLCLGVLEDEAHVTGSGAEFTFKEVFALGDVPVEVEAELGEEHSFHLGMARVQFHDSGGLGQDALLHNTFYHFVF